MYSDGWDLPPKGSVQVIYGSDPRCAVKVNMTLDQIRSFPDSIHLVVHDLVAEHGIRERAES